MKRGGKRGPYSSAGSVRSYNSWSSKRSYNSGGSVSSSKPRSNYTYNSNRMRWLILHYCFLHLFMETSTKKVLESKCSVKAILKKGVIFSLCYSWNSDIFKAINVNINLIILWLTRAFHSYLSLHKRFLKCFWRVPQAFPHWCITNYPKRLFLFSGFFDS